MKMSMIMSYILESMFVLLQEEKKKRPLKEIVIKADKMKQKQNKSFESTDKLPKLI